MPVGLHQVRVRLGEHFSCQEEIYSHGITERVRNCVSLDFHILGLHLFIEVLNTILLMVAEVGDISVGKWI